MEVEITTTVERAPRLWPTDLQQHDFPVAGREVIGNRVEIAPEAPVVRHKHPGDEIIYVLEGLAGVRHPPVRSLVSNRAGADGWARARGPSRAEPTT